MKTSAKWFTTMAVSAAMVVLASCGSTAHIEKDETADFTKYKTFAWQQENSTATTDLGNKKLMDAVAVELEDAGWRKTTGRPDVYLTYDVVVENNQVNSSDPVYSRPTIRTFYNPYTRRFTNVYFPSEFMGYDNYTRNVKEGTVTISMIEAATDKTVWQGWTTMQVDGKKLTQKEVENSVRTIFKKFDIAKS